MELENLATSLKEKVSFLLEETMEKSWGLYIPRLETELSDRLKNPHLDFYVPANLKFREAKKVFKEEFLKRELLAHQGNVSQLAKFLGLDRRSIHRAVKDLGLGLKRLREKEAALDNYQAEVIDNTIRKTLQAYKEIIQPKKMELMYEEIPRLSKNIAQFIPHQTLTWKKAEQEFERQFLLLALKGAEGKIKQAAERVGLRPETLHRKIKKLGLKE